MSSLSCSQSLYRLSHFQIDSKSKGLITSVTSHASRVLAIAKLKVLILIEDGDGNRYWSGNGRLRNEFVKEGKVENRYWGMFEVKVRN